jgi:rRNA maturation endonuclease Nob1
MPDDDISPEERAALEKDILETEQKMAMAEGWKYVCRHCGKTPQDIGWCDDCGYNRDYEKSRTITIQYEASH